MISIQTFSPIYRPTPELQKESAGFLAEHLGDFGDPVTHIEKAIRYALGEDRTPGGLLLLAWKDTLLAGAVVINRTGMKEYIPENILVYIAVHKECRGQGLGRQLMRKAIQEATGNIALHVEPENPARKLYEQLGFTNKYLEMRLIK